MGANLKPTPYGDSFVDDKPLPERCPTCGRHIAEYRRLPWRNLVAAYEGGLTVRDIVRETGLRRMSVYRCLVAYGAKMRQTGPMRFRAAPDPVRPSAAERKDVAPDGSTGDRKGDR